MSLKDIEKVNQALSELGITEYVIDGLPTNESEFNSMFQKVTSVSNGRAVLSSNPSDFGVTWSQVKTKIDAKGYQQERKEAYGDNLNDMIIALWEKVIESNDDPAAAIQTARQTIKDNNPKP